VWAIAQHHLIGMTQSHELFGSRPKMAT
jgi:hypothetical protein